MPRLIVIGCGRATEAPAQAVNNYSDVRAAARRTALTAVTHTRKTVRRWRSVRSCFTAFVPFAELWIESGTSEDGGDVRAEAG